MAILDGLKNGYATYFMYQPSQGLNPQLLNYAMRDRSRGTGSTGGTRSATKDDEFPEGLKKAQIDYATQKMNLDRTRSSLATNLRNAIVRADFQNINDLPEMKAYVQAIPKIQEEEYRLSINENLMKQNKDQYYKTIGDMESRGIKGRIAVIPTGTSAGIGGTGLQVAAYKIVDGKKEMTDAFVQDEKGDWVINNNADGFMTNEDFMQWQAENIGYGRDGFIREFMTPQMYKAGVAREKFETEIAASAAKEIEGISQIVVGAGAKSRVVNQSVRSNYNNLMFNVKTAMANLSDPDAKADIMSEYMDAAESDSSYYVLDEKNNVKEKKVRDMSVQEYVASKVANLAVDRRSMSQSYAEMPGQGSENTNDSMTIESVVTHPALISQEGTTALRNIMITGGTGDKPGESINRGTYVTVPTIMLDAGPAYRAQRNNIMRAGKPGNPTSIDELPNMSDIESSNKGVITPWGTVINPAKVQGKFLSVTGNVVLAPKLKEGLSGKFDSGFDYVEDPATKGPKKFTFREYGGKIFEEGKTVASRPGFTVSGGPDVKTRESYEFKSDIYEEEWMVVRGDALADELGVPVQSQRKGAALGDWEYKTLDWAYKNGKIHTQDIIRIDETTKEVDPKLSIKEGDKSYYKIKVLVKKSLIDAFEHGDKASKENYNMFIDYFTSSAIANTGERSDIENRSKLLEESNNQQRVNSYSLK